MCGLIFFKGAHFNHPVNDLPQKLIFLTFGHYFNQPINNLPPSLKQIQFGKYFSEKIDNLPDSVTHLIFLATSDYQHPIQKLPKNLAHFEIPGKNYFWDDIPRIFLVTNLPLELRQFSLTTTTAENQLENQKNFDSVLVFTKIPSLTR